MALSPIPTIADGWLAVFFAPGYADEQLTQVDAGRATAGRDRAGFDVVATIPLVVGADARTCADPVRAYTALYVGGMGSRDKNFYNQLACRMGFEEAAAEVQDLFLAKRHRDAAAAVPFEFIDATTLIGPRDRIRERLVRYADAGVGTLSIAPFAGGLEDQLRVVRTMAEVMGETGA